VELFTDNPIVTSFSFKVEVKPVLRTWSLAQHRAITWSLKNVQIRIPPGHSHTTGDYGQIVLVAICFGTVTRPVAPIAHEKLLVHVRPASKPIKGVLLCDKKKRRKATRSEHDIC